MNNLLNIFVLCYLQDFTSLLCILKSLYKDCKAWRKGYMQHYVVQTVFIIKTLT